MTATALHPIGHLAAWLLWHMTRVSLLNDLVVRARPGPAEPSSATEPLE